MCLEMHLKRYEVKAYPFSYLFSYIKKEEHKGFRRYSLNFERFKDSWFQTLSFLIRDHVLYSSEDLWIL